MAVIRVEFFSNCLIRQVAFEMFLPNDFRDDMPRQHEQYYKRKCKTVFVLHGFKGWGKGWTHMYELADKYNLALVFPSGENHFYLDTEDSAGKYGTFIGVELVDYIRRTFGLCSSRDDTYISGLSMGGFGALRTGLAYPDTFGKIAALSSALIMHDICGMKPGEFYQVGNYYYFRNCFGDLDKLIESENNPETLVKKNLNQGKVFPDIYMACGTDDFLLKHNKRFYDFLLTHNVKAEYIEDNGSHDMEFWNKYFAKSFEWMA